MNKINTKLKFKLPSLDDVKELMSHLESGSSLETDFVKIMGCNFGVIKRGSFIIEGGIYTNTMFSDGKGWEAHAIMGLDGKTYASGANTIYESMCVIPQISFSEIKDKCKTIERGDNYSIVTFGEYLYDRPSAMIRDNLTKLFDNGELYTTGKSYIVGVGKNRRSLTEYKYENKKYVRIKENTRTWIEVCPIKWLVVNGVNAIAMQALFTNVPINKVDEFFKKYFVEDIMPINEELEISKDENNSPVINIIENSKIDFNKAISELNSMQVPTIDTSDINSLVNYGDALLKHNDIVNDEYRRLIVNNLLETSLSNIEALVNKVYSTEYFKSKKSNIFDRLLHKKGTIQNEQAVIDINVLNQLNESIDNAIFDLGRELSGYNNIKKYYEIYINKLKLHVKNINEKIEEENQIIKSLQDNNSRLNHTTVLEILKGIQSNFEISLTSKMAELIQIHEAILNHFATITTLKTAKEDLIPLIANELVMTNGRKSQSISTELSKCVVGLFNSLLERNAEGTKQNLERLKQTNLPYSTVSKISNDLGLYINSKNCLDSPHNNNHEDDDELSLHLKR